MMYKYYETFQSLINQSISHLFIQGGPKKPDHF